jgi:hypothetical protein
VDHGVGLVSLQAIEGNPRLFEAARVIHRSLRTWSFPAPGEVKQVQIPFVFVRQ